MSQAPSTKDDPPDPEPSDVSPPYGGDCQVVNSCLSDNTARDHRSMNFHVGSFPSEALEVMNQLRAYKKLCDVEIHVGTEAFPVHKVVMAACSPYFKAMFTSGLKESDMSVIHIQGVCPLTMACIIRFAYTGRIKVSEVNICNLLPAATMFQITRIIKACCTFLEKQLDTNNCIGIGDFALQYGCTELAEKTEHFINQHFSQVSLSEEFLGLTTCELVALIRRDELNVRSESEVFDAVLRWIEHDREVRIPKLADILYCVRCHFLTPRFLREKIQSCEIVKSMPQCIQYLTRIIQDLTVRHEVCCKQRKPKGPFVIYIAGGYQKKSLSNMECFDPREQRWYSLAPLPTPRSGLAGAFIEGKLYVLGGRNNSMVSENSDLSNLECYDPMTNTWRSCRPLATPRNRVGAGVLDGLLYAVGGSYGYDHLQSVERYDPVEDTWSFVRDLQEPRMGIGVAVCNRLLYAVGGFNGSQRLDSVEVYDPESDRWSLLASMNSKRSGAGVIALENYVYAIGGYDGHSQLSSAERYCPEKNEWEVIAPMMTPRSALSVAALDGHIYAMGGYDSNSFLTTVEMYDPATNQWTTGPPLPRGCSGHTAAAWTAPCLVH